MNGYLQIERPIKNRVRSEDVEKYLFVSENQYPIFVSRGFNTQTVVIDSIKEDKTIRKTVHRIQSNGFDLSIRSKKTVVVKYSEKQKLDVSKLTRSVWIVPTGVIVLDQIPEKQPGDILVQGDRVYIFHDSFWVLLGFDSGACNSDLFVQELEPSVDIGDRWLNPVSGLLLTRTTNEIDEEVWSELYYASGICDFADISYSETPPANPILGDRWFDSGSGTLYTYIVDINNDFFWIDTSI
jgi:hypothetical protein